MTYSRLRRWVASIAILAFCTAPSAIGGPPPTDDRSAEEPRISIAIARDRAKVMQHVYSATLDMMHDRYFHGDRAVVPARAMEDVFEAMEKQLGAEAHWISVNTKPMSLHHEPTSDFDKKAAAAIAAGKEEFELVQEGYYRRAGAIPLTGGCVSCHSGFFATPPKSPRFAGLVIEIPIDEK